MIRIGSFQIRTDWEVIHNGIGIEEGCGHDISVRYLVIETRKHKVNLLTGVRHRVDVARAGRQSQAFGLLRAYLASEEQDEKYTQ